MSQSAGSSLALRNPHSVLAALQTRPDDVLRVALPPSGGQRGATEAAGDAWEQVAKLARQHKIQVQTASPAAAAGDSRGRDKDRDGGRVSGAHAVVRERMGISAEQLFDDARERVGGKGLWLALDSLQDPQNVGAIFRTAAFFGVKGIHLTTERSAPLSAAAYDVASGGMEYVPFTQQVNLQRGFEAAKEAGLWILGTSEHARETLGGVQKDRPWLVVLGNEERGIRRLTEESCDVMCRIDPKGEGVKSLNVSVAAGILMSTLG
jgi:23S rRNA (guanosine2251-2'-O)-methyltransferase